MRSFRLTTDRYPPASLGCGTLLIIALIVFWATSAAYQNMSAELSSLRTQVEELKRSVDAQTEQIRSLKEQTKGPNPSPKPVELERKN
jgi:type II secretory pathway component PulM